MKSAHLPALQIDQPLERYSPRDVAVLQAIGRLEMLDRAALHRLIFPDQHANSARRKLLALTRQQLIWKRNAVQGTTEVTRTRPPRPAPAVYGLTAAGKEVLLHLACEPNAKIVHAFPVRDPRQARTQDFGILRSIVAANWCASLIDGIRRVAALEGIYCQVGIVDPKRKANALMMFWFGQAKLQDQPGWMIPWFTNQTVTDDHIIVRFGLEIDDGAEALDFVVQRVLNYKETKQGSSAVFPVVMTSTANRRAALIQEVATHWPACPGRIMLRDEAIHPEHGAAWANLWSLGYWPPRSHPLLYPIIPTVEAWEKQLRGWCPGMPPRR